MKYLLIIIIVICNNTSAYSQWDNLLNGTNNRVEALFSDSISQELFIGGEFNYVGGQNIKNIATWNGNNWTSFGNNAGFSNSACVNSIIRFNGFIVIGGLFDSINQIPIKNIALWNGTSWVQLGNGFDGPVNTLIEYKGELYAGGQFTYSGNQRLVGLSRWDGIQWNQVVDLNGYVFTFEIFQNKLIVGGGFQIQNMFNIRNIFAWDGNNLDSSLHGFNDWVLSLNNVNDTLYAVGSFTSIPNNPYNYIAQYYNSFWHNIGAPTGGSNWVTSSCQYLNQMYFSGYFSNPPDICKFNGMSFVQLLISMVMLKDY